ASSARASSPPKSAGAVIRLFDGRYGPYLTDGVVNATVPKGVTLESITLETALELLSEKAAKGPSKRPAKRSRAPKRKK
ncbi:MAG TPA: topoisomerase C-terminal repeat-containing protein, partial [Candidatus Deferrimicrobium sp.]